MTLPQKRITKTEAELLVVIVGGLVSLVPVSGGGKEHDVLSWFRRVHGSCDGQVSRNLYSFIRSCDNGPIRRVLSELCIR
jgi:hypothetical protein